MPRFKLGHERCTLYLRNEKNESFTNVLQYLA
jgi:hypothetical protein